jgi:dUTP pyrophosphatase
MIKIAKLYTSAKLPTRKFPEDAGIDLYANIFIGSPHYWEIFPNNPYIVPTGITMEIPDGHVGLIYPKSRNNYLIGAGVIDSNYQGEILVKIVNFTKSVLQIRHHDAIAQMVIVPAFISEIEEVARKEIHKNLTNRGETGGIVSQNA